MEFARSKSDIFVTQRNYILDLLKETSLFGCKIIETTTEQNLKLQDTTGKEVKENEKY